MTAISPKTQALKALDGMGEIVRAEMLIQGVYVEDEVSNPRRTDAICGGHKHCAIGSLWVGAGVKPISYGAGVLTLPGATCFRRRQFLAHRHGLRVALDALNAAAVAFAKRRKLYLAPDDDEDAIEELFEGYYGDDLTKRDMLAIIATAKQNVKAS